MIKYPLHYLLRWPFYYWRPKLKLAPDFICQPMQSEKIPDMPIVKRLVFVGDILKTNQKPLPIVSPKLQDIFDRADHITANVEGILDLNLPVHKRQFFSYKMSANQFKSLCNHFGLDNRKTLFSIANNHSLDYGNSGLHDTQQALMEYGYNFLGKTEPQICYTITWEGGRCGLIAWTHWHNHPFNELKAPIKETGSVLDTDIAKIKQEHTLDLLIGYPHWDFEFSHTPHGTTRTCATRLIQNGFDTIIGHHAHVPQVMECIDKKPVFYNLGNFYGIELGFYSKIILVLELSIHHAKEQAAAISYTLHPFYHDRTGGLDRFTALADCSVGVKAKINQRLSQMFRMQ